MELEDLISEQRENILHRFNENMIEALKQLASAASELAPEHGRATYGVVERRLLPSEIYGKAEASRALSLAEAGCKTAKRFVKEWFVCTTEF